MPKVTKKKKEKTADFSKAKLKLGKGKKLPTNSTNTSFKARSIALPGQTPLKRALATYEHGQSRSDPALPPTTSRGLFLDDVLVLLRHPNGGVRRDALSYLKEILVNGVEKGVALGRREGEVVKVVRALGGLINDEDGTVRKSLLAFFAWYIPLLPESILSPHLPLLLLQMSSALSHIFPDIRLDACRLVHLLLEQVPSYVVGSWPCVPSVGPSSSKHTLDDSSGTGSTILEGLRLAVGLGGDRGSSSQMGFKITPASKLVTLRTLLAFISQALGQTTEIVGGAELNSMRIFGSWVETTHRKMRKEVTRVVSEIGVHPREEGWFAGLREWGSEQVDQRNWEIGRISSGNGHEDVGAIGVLAQLYLTLQPLLLSTFLESVPIAFAPSQNLTTASEDVPLALCSVTASITDTLAKAILSPPVSTCPNQVKQVVMGISDFHRRMAGWFPFQASRTPSKPLPGLSADLSLSLSYANIGILLAPAVEPLSLPNRTLKEAKWKDRARAVEAAWLSARESESRLSETQGNRKAKVADVCAIDEVAEWIVDILGLSSDGLVQPISPDAYSSVLSIVWDLIIQPRTKDADHVSESVGLAFLKHLSLQNPNSVIRKLGDDFLIELVLLHEDRYSLLPFLIPPSSGTRPLFQNWFENVPRTLWELGTKDENASESLLRFLLEIGLRGKGALEPPYSLIESRTFSVMASRLTPFFHLVHPTKGAIPGPWTKLKSALVRKLSLEVAKIWIEWDEGNLKVSVDAVVGQGRWKEFWSK